MFIKKDLRKVHQIIEDPDDERTEIKLFRRGPEFVKGPGIIFKPEYVSAFAKLKYLSLYGNSLHNVDAIEVLRDSPLEELNLGDNLLRVLPEGFRELKQLRVLWLEDNEFESFPGQIFGMEHLERLCFSNNALQTVPPEIRTLPSLERLSLNNNALKSIPSQISLLQKLTYLDFSLNSISELPQSLGELDHLQTFIVSSNIIEAIPKSFAGMHSLRKLRINKNELVKLPQFLVDLATKHSLRYVNASNNELLSIPLEFGDFLPNNAEARKDDRAKDSPLPSDFSLVLLGNPNASAGLADVTPTKKSRATTDEYSTSSKGIE